MAELKKFEGGRVSQPSGPSFEGAAKGVETLAKVGDAAFKAVGDIVKANDALEEATLKSKATSDLDRLYTIESENPFLGEHSLTDFKDKSDAVISGYLNHSKDAYAKRLNNSLQEEASKYTNKLFAKAYKKVIQDQDRDAQVNFSDDLDRLSRTIEDGDEDSAVRMIEEMTNKSDALYVRGGSVKEYEKRKEDILVSVGTSMASRKIRLGNSKQNIKTIRGILDLPKTSANEKIIKNAMTMFNRKQKVYKEAFDLTPGLQNAATGNNHDNLGADTKTTNESVSLIGSNIVAINDRRAKEGLPPMEFAGQEMALPRQVADVVSKPVFFDDEKEKEFQSWYKKWVDKTGLSKNPDDPMHNYDYRAAYEKDASPKLNKADGLYHWPEEYKADNYPNGLRPSNGSEMIFESTVDSLQDKPQRAPTMMELVQAHTVFGSKNGQGVSRALEGALINGNGAAMDEASRALDYGLNVNKASMNISKHALAMHTAFKTYRDKAGLSLDEAARRATELVAAEDDKKTKIWGNRFDDLYGYGSDKKLGRLNNRFKEVFGHNAVKTGSLDSLASFHELYRANFITLKNDDMALEATVNGLNMAGVDRFSYNAPRSRTVFGGMPGLPSDMLGYPDSDKRFTDITATKAAPSMPPIAIQNALQRFLVHKSRTSDTFTIPERYSDIYDASEAELYGNNLSHVNKKSVLFGANGDPILEIGQTIGSTKVNGTVFLKANALTLQNDTGLPVFEVWQQDDKGREYRIIDDSSPIGNTLLFQVPTLEMFTPKEAERIQQEKLEEETNKILKLQGKKAFPLNPERYYTKEGGKALIPSLMARSAFRKDIDNIEAAEKQARKLLKMPPKDAE